MDNYTIIESLGLDIKELAKFEPILDTEVIYVFIVLKRMIHKCPYCGSEKLYLKERKTGMVKSALLTSVAYLEVKYPRYLCCNCRRTFSQKLSISYSTNKSKRFVDKVLRECLKVRTYLDIADQFDTNAMEIMRIFDKFHPNLREEIGEIICIDEFSNTRKSYSKYACMIVNFETHKIVHILRDRKLDYLREYLRKQPKYQLNRVIAACVDMYDGYITAVQEFMPNAEIVIDPFHYMRYFTDALQKIRIRIVDDECNYLDKTRFKKHRKMYTKRSEELPEELMILNSGEAISYYDRINRFIKNNYELDYPYHLLQDFYFTSKRCNYTEGCSLIENTIRRMEQSGIEELQECASTRSNYKEFIKNSFKLYKGKRVTNGPIEGINSRVKSYKKLICGYKDYERFYERVIYVINSSKKGKAD